MEQAVNSIIMREKNYSPSYQRFLCLRCDAIVLCITRNSRNADSRTFGSMYTEKGILTIIWTEVISLELRT